MGLMFTGIFLNLIGVFLFNDYIAETGREAGAEIFILIVAGCWLVSLIGGILAAFNQRRLGAILVMVGSVIFAPLGMVAFFGAIKVKNEAEPKQPDLDLRRQLAKREMQNHDE